MHSSVFDNSQGCAGRLQWNYICLWYVDAHLSIVLTDIDFIAHLGQTGAGKTYTMFGPDKIENPEDRGIVPRTSAYVLVLFVLLVLISYSHIFDHIDSDSTKREYAIKCSFLEIYKEVVRDLLNPKNTDMKIRESPHKGVWVDGLTEEVHLP